MTARASERQLRKRAIIEAFARNRCDASSTDAHDHAKLRHLGDLRALPEVTCPKCDQVVRLINNRHGSFLTPHDYASAQEPHGRKVVNKPRGKPRDVEPIDNSNAGYRWWSSQ